jgi:hypothetical protein
MQDFEGGVATRAVMFLSFCFLSSSALDDQKAVDCGEYKKILNDNMQRAQLLQWADSEIFSRRFEKKDFEEVLGFVGPGRNGADLSIDRSGIKVPAWLNGYAIRSVGPDKYHPNVVFVARRRYQGILITRGEFEESLKGTNIDKSGPEERKGRLAMICAVD